jgi:hypothetical protein
MRIGELLAAVFRRTRLIFKCAFFPSPALFAREKVAERSEVG